jgi:sortase A
MKTTNRRRWGNLFIILGLLFLAAAVGLIGYNVWEDQQAGAYSREILQQMLSMAKTEESEDSEAESVRDDLGRVPLYVSHPEMEMPTAEIDGNFYIGRIEIPSVSIDLPVLSEWSYPNLKLAPCRYTGSAYQNNLILAGHNYVNHFRTLKNVSIGDPVYFTDMDGNVFTYEVAAVEQLEPTDVEEMQSGDWALTIFTCTIGGQYRVTVRCDFVRSDAR